MLQTQTSWSSGNPVGLSILRLNLPWLPDALPCSIFCGNMNKGARTCCLFSSLLGQTRKQLEAASKFASFLCKHTQTNTRTHITKKQDQQKREYIFWHYTCRHKSTSIIFISIYWLEGVCSNRIGKQPRVLDCTSSIKVLADVKMEIPVLVRSLKSSILSSTSLQMDKTFWGMVSAAVEQSRRRTNMVARGNEKFGPLRWPQNHSKTKKNGYGLVRAPATLICSSALNTEAIFKKLKLNIITRASKLF